jgi:hypothetical protein
MVWCHGGLASKYQQFWGVGEYESTCFGKHVFRNRGAVLLRVPPQKIYRGKNEKVVERKVLLQAFRASRNYWVRDYHIRSSDKSLRGYIWLLRKILVSLGRA